MIAATGWGAVFGLAMFAAGVAVCTLLVAGIIDDRRLDRELRRRREQDLAPVGRDQVHEL